MLLEYINNFMCFVTKSMPVTDMRVCFKFYSSESIKMFWYVCLLCVNQLLTQMKYCERFLNTSKLYQNKIFWFFDIFLTILSNLESKYNNHNNYLYSALKLRMIDMLSSHWDTEIQLFYEIIYIWFVQIFFNISLIFNVKLSDILRFDGKLLYNLEAYENILFSHRLIRDL